MLIIERFFRRAAYSFGVAGLLTVGFTNSPSLFHIPMITYFVALILFGFSWRIQREYREIIMKIDGPDTIDPSNSWFGDLYEKSPHQYHILWEGFYTFGAVLIATVAAKGFGYDAYSKESYLLGLFSIVFFLVMRLFDPKAKRQYYNK